MFKRILVPLDGSGFGSRAITYADKIGQQFGAEVVLLQVVKPAAPIATTGGAMTGIESPAAAELAVKAALETDAANVTKARRYLSRKVRGIRSHGINSEYKVLVGDPARTIMNFARKERIDLIAMTTHGKGGFKRAVMGSTADKVIRESGKPVLVIRPRTSPKK